MSVLLVLSIFINSNGSFSAELVDLINREDVNQPRDVSFVFVIFLKIHFYDLFFFGPNLIFDGHFGGLLFVLHS